MPDVEFVHSRVVDESVFEEKVHQTIAESAVVPEAPTLSQLR